MTGGPLQGMTVVSIEQAVAAPFATRQLADLGARVIKIERHEGDFARDYDATVRGSSSYFTWLNRGKESVVVDLKSATGIDLVRRITAQADVFVQNLAPGAVERLGLDPARLVEEFPRLVAASISGYGRGGPYEQKKAYDLLIQCEAGLLSLTGSEEHPAKAGISVADIAAGMYTYSGILAALFERERRGVGQVLEVSMLEALGEWMSQPYLFAEYGGSAPRRAGAKHASIAPYGPVRCADGIIFVAVQNDREWDALCRTVLGRPDLADETRFRGNARRVENRDELDDVLSGIFAVRSISDVEQALDAASIANARLRTMHEYAEHPQLEARGRWQYVSSPAGPVRASIPPVTVAGRTMAMGRVPALGEHTERVAREFAISDGDHG